MFQSSWSFEGGVEGVCIQLAKRENHSTPLLSWTRFPSSKRVVNTSFPIFQQNKTTLMGDFAMADAARSQITQGALEYAQTFPHVILY
jgi:hypothetical protein